MIRLSAALIFACSLLRQEDQLPPQPPYETRERHDPNGINKWYLGREIAHVMGPGGIPWLERPERENEENPTKCIEALDLKGGEVIADLGAGSGYYSFRLAPKVGEKGKVLAVEIQDEMIAELKKRIEKQKISNVETVKCTESDPKLPEGGVDLVLMVDVYHELAFPYEVMLAIRKALKPDGRVVLVEYRKEDPKVPIKEVHKMSEEQIRKEMAVVGLHHLKTVGTLPWQHIAIYTKKKPEQEPGVEMGFRMNIPDARKGDRAKIAAEMEKILRKRLEGSSVGRFILKIEDDLVTLQLPGGNPEAAADAKPLLGTVGQLHFRPAAPRDLQESYNKDKAIPEGWEVVENPDPPRGGEYEAYGKELLVRKDSVIEGSHIVKVDARQEKGGGIVRWTLSVELDAEGAKLFDEAAAKLSNQNPKGMLAILLDGKIRSLPVVQSPVFRGRIQITGMKSKQEARDLAIILRSGVLPVPLGGLEFERMYGPKK